jgi:hypothetical protein
MLASGRLLWFDNTNTSTAQALQKLLAAIKNLDYASHDSLGLE